MNEKEKYYFIPVPKKAKNLDSGVYSVSISKAGNVYLGRQTVIKYIGVPKFLRIFLDQEKRTVALQPSDTLTPGDKHSRMIVLRKDGSVTFSIHSLLKALQAFGQCFSGLELSEYVDKNYGKLVVFKIPK